MQRSLGEARFARERTYTLALASRGFRVFVHYAILSTVALAFHEKAQPLALLAGKQPRIEPGKQASEVRSTSHRKLTIGREKSIGLALAGLHIDRFKKRMLLHF